MPLLFYTESTEILHRGRRENRDFYRNHSNFILHSKQYLFFLSVSSVNSVVTQRTQRTQRIKTEMFTAVVNRLKKRNLC